MSRPAESLLNGSQLDLVAGYADLRGDRSAEILAQLGVPTPFLSLIAFLDGERTPKTLELIHAALRFAYFVVMQVKAGLACRRPHEYSPQIQAMIPAPLHGTLPSGHATEATIAAYVLYNLLSRVPVPLAGVPYFGNNPGWRTQLMRLASRIAINRTIAGVHFPVDSIAGMMLGLTLGEYFVERCTRTDANAAGGYGSWTLDGAEMSNAVQPLDFVWHRQFDVVNAVQTAVPPYIAGPVAQTLGADGRSAALEWIWNEALTEWR